MAVVQEATDSGKEVKCVLTLVVRAIQIVAEELGPCLVLAQGVQDGQPLREVIVAQATGALLDVGLEMEDGVAEPGVARAGDLGEVLHDYVPLAECECGEDIVFEAAIEAEVSGKEAAVEERDGELEIVWVDLVAFLEGASGGAGAQACVPQGLRDGAEGLVGVALGGLAGAEVEDVNVRVREELAAPIASGGDNGDVGAFFFRSEARPDFVDDVVDDGGTAPDGGSAVSGSLEGLAQVGALFLIEIGQLRQRCHRRVHGRRKATTCSKLYCCQRRE